jgi:hypothetical protein
MRRLILTAFLAIALAGCSTTQSVLSPYIAIPDSCEEIDRQLIAYAEHDLKIFNLRKGKELGVTVIGVAASLSYIPSIFALVPTVAYQVQLGTHTERIRHLAIAREIKGCPELIVNEDTNNAQRSIADLCGALSSESAGRCNP